MGSDKALLDVGGRPLAARGIDALHAVGISDVMLIGATEAQADALDGRPVEDLWPGEGPVGGVLTALHAAFVAGATQVLCLSCDLPSIDAAAVAALRDAAVAGRPALAAVDGRAAYPNGLWPTAVLPRLEDRFVDGADAFGDVLGDVEFDLIESGDAFVDADEPGDLARFL